MPGDDTHWVVTQYNEAMIPGAILAAGESRRMGRPKAWLLCGPEGEPFVRRLTGSLLEGGAETVLLVGRPEDERLRSEAEVGGPRVRFVANRGADTGQISSVLAALEVADRPGVRGLLVVPVDQPLIQAETIARLIAAFTSTGAPIARAVHRGRHGHPVIFGRPTFAELRRADRAVGAKAVVRAHALDLLDVEVEDPGVVEDIDTPADYERIFGHAL